MFTITQAMRDAAWDWRDADHPQPFDQHVRDHLKADDGAVMGQTIAAEVERQFYANPDNMPW